MTPDDDRPHRGRTVPQAEHPEGPWLAPIRGVFHDLYERWANPFEEEPFSIDLGAGVVWRSTTSEDQAHIGSWFDFYRASHSEQEREMATSADSVLASAGPIPLDDQRRAYPALVAFILALSLHASAHLRGHLLLFEIEATIDRRVLPVGGYQPIETALLPGWPRQAPVGRTELEQIPAAYRAIHRAFQQPPEHGFLRALGSYRAAMSTTVFMNPIPVLLCASLESLTAGSREAIVIRRLARRYGSAADARDDLEALYRLRQWFAHGATVPSMRDGAERVRALVNGITATKAVLREALSDDELFEAGGRGSRAVQRLLGG